MCDCRTESSFKTVLEAITALRILGGIGWAVVSKSAPLIVALHVFWLSLALGARQWSQMYMDDPSPYVFRGLGSTA